MQNQQSEMEMDSVFTQLKKTGIVPVVKIEDGQNAVPLANALREGGLNCAEITFRTAAAETAIAAITGQYPDMLVGAGTVLTTAQVDQAVAAGAKFIVSPGLNPEVVRHCIEKKVPVIPGVCTPSEIEQALGLGLTVVKFFPSEASGGVAMIKALSAPFGDLSFVPTGGVNKDNMNQYLEFPKVLACGGSWMVKESLIAEKRFDEIATLTRQAVETMLGFEVAHIGINFDDEPSASKASDDLENLFGFAKKIGNSSIFSSTALELMKSRYLGTHGHIAVRTNSIERARYHLESRGVAFREDSAKRDANGRLLAIYLEKEIGGFAVHLSQK